MPAGVISRGEVDDLDLDPQTSLLPVRQGRCQPVAAPSQSARRVHATVTGPVDRLLSTGPCARAESKSGAIDPVRVGTSGHPTEADAPGSPPAHRMFRLPEANRRCAVRSIQANSRPLHTVPTGTALHEACSPVRGGSQARSGRRRPGADDVGHHLAETPALAQGRYAAPSNRWPIDNLRSYLLR